MYGPTGGQILFVIALAMCAGWVFFEKVLPFLILIAHTFLGWFI